MMTLGATSYSQTSVLKLPAKRHFRGRGGQGGKWLVCGFEPVRMLHLKPFARAVPVELLAWCGVRAALVSPAWGPTQMATNKPAAASHCPRVSPAVTKRSEDRVTEGCV